MDKLYLQDWNAKKNIICIEPQSGKYVIKSDVDKDDYVIKGFASIIDNDVIGVYTEDSFIYFLYNNHRYDINDPKFKIFYKRFLWYEFLKIQVDQKMLVKKKYNSIRAFKEKFIDQTYDRVDEDAAYFLLWLTRSIKSAAWKSNFIKSHGEK